MRHAPRDPDFERRTRESFARQGAMALIGTRLERVEPGVVRSGRTLTVGELDVYVEKAGRRHHCATGLQTLMSVVGRAGVKD